MADGWILDGGADRNRKSVEKLHAYLEEQGRTPDSFGLDVSLNLGQTPQTEWGDWIEQWREAGATHARVNTMGMGLTSTQDHINAIRRFRATLGD